MLDLTNIVLLIAGLLVVIAVLQPLAHRLNLPSSVLLAAVGVGIGAIASFLLYTTLTNRFNELAAPIVHLPIRSSTFIYVFLPLLLFQAALTIDVARMKEDAAPILMLAVVAVVVTTVVAGVGLHWLFGIPLVACLLLGSIISTTDPAAVVAIFRDIGAPARLTRLVEGESLLNDAAAIALFTLLLGLLAEGRPFDPLAGVSEFLTAFFGGILLGFFAGKGLVLALRGCAGLKAAEATLTVAASYIIFIVGEHVLNVSGVVAVVVMGLGVSAWGRAAVLPENWQHLDNVWEQIAFWAGSLVFILAAILVPRLLADVDARDALIILALIVAATIARAAVLFLLLPLLSLVRLTKPVSHRYKAAILWGGLRGAVTLALALAIVENPALTPQVKHFVAVAATGFVLITLFVNGTTLRTVIGKLKLDRLTARDQLLRDQVLALSLAEVHDEVREEGRRYEVAEVAMDPVLDYYQQRMASVSERAEAVAQDTLLHRERLAVALTALANRERELILEHHAHQLTSSPVIDKLLRHAEHIVDGALADGRTGYNRAARQVTDFRRSFRIAHFLHRNFRLQWLLARQLAERLEMLLVVGLVLDALERFARERLTPLFGARIAELVDEILAARMGATQRAVDALRLQYPDYARALEGRFVWQRAERFELEQYDLLRQEGLLSRDLYDDLRRGAHHARRAAEKRPRLDLGLKIPEMVSRLELLQGLDPKQLKQVCRLFRSELAVPGEFIMRKGERGTRVYFISSGAVEIRLPERTIRYGRGEFFGELALLNHGRRTADIVALSYCTLLTLDSADFRRFLDMNPAIRAHIETVAEARIASLAHREPDIETATVVETETETENEAGQAA